MSEMADQIMKVLTDQGNYFVDLVKHNLDKTGTTATGKSKESLHVIVTQEGQKFSLEVLAKPYFGVVETGRKPTPEKKPGRAMIEAIKEWTEVRGMVGAEWAIAVKINNEGTRLWKKGGRTDIYTDESQPFTDRVADDVTKLLADAIINQVPRNEFNG